MATTVGNFTAIDDSEVDAESPITESLVTRLRDNAYWVNEGTTQTSQGTGDKLLQTDGSGGVEWIDKDTIGVDGTKGSGVGASTAGTITILTNKILLITVSVEETSDGSTVGAGGIIIDSSDDTYVGQNTSGTLNGTYATIIDWAVFTGRTPSANIQMRKNGANYELYTGAANRIARYSYVWM